MEAELGGHFDAIQSDQIPLYAGVIRSTGNGYSILPDDARTDLHLDDQLFIAALSWDGTLKRGIVPSVRLYYSTEPSSTALPRWRNV